VVWSQATCAEVCLMESHWHQWPHNEVVSPGIPHGLGTHRVCSLEALRPSSLPVPYKKTPNMQGCPTHRFRSLVQTFLIFLCFAYARRMSLVLSRGMEGGRAVDAVEACMAETVVLVELWFFYNVTAAWIVNRC